LLHRDLHGDAQFWIEILLELLWWDGDINDLRLLLLKDARLGHRDVFYILIPGE
jgi:hypothetical protein